MKNQEIRNAAEKAGIKLWQLAYALGVTDGTLSRKLRKEFSDDEKHKALSTIETLRKEA